MSDREDEQARDVMQRIQDQIAYYIKKNLQKFCKDCQHRLAAPDRTCPNMGCKFSSSP